jgi:transcription antitermination factor NusG
VEDSEITALRRVDSADLLVQPWPYLQVGQRVAIQDGVLAGLEGILLDVKKSWRLVVSVDLLQRSVAVEVDRTWVRPVSVQSAREVLRAAIA